MAKNFPNLKKETDIQVQEVWRVPNKMNLNRPTPRHIIMKILKELRQIIERNADHCNKEVKTIKMNQSKLDNSIAKVKTNLEAMNSRLNDTKEQISDLEDRIMEITKSQRQMGKKIYEII